MNILILSVTAGGGHNCAARAMQEYFRAAGAQSEILDIYGYIAPAIASSINKGYLWLASRAKRAYGLGYHIAEKRTPLRIAEITPAEIVHMPVAWEIHQYIEKNRPDAIIFTHAFAGIILHTLKREGKISVPTVGILTDFAFHPYWEDATANDYVVIPSPHLRFQGMRKGFREEQLLPFGIPVSLRFGESMPKEQARHTLGLSPNNKTVLVMSGSMGYGKMAETLTALDGMPLDEDFQIIAVCGSNRKLHEEIDTLGLRHRILNLGFADNVDLLMDASDVIVTKPGGLTTSEALVKRLPMVIANPVPGQEMRNTEFLLNCGAAVASNGVCSAAELTYRLLSSDARREAMRLSIEELRRPDSTKDICEFVMGLLKNPSP